MQRSQSELEACATHMPWPHLAASLIVLPPHVQHVVLLKSPGDQEVHERRWADQGVDAAEHQAQQDDDGVIWDLQAAKKESNKNIQENKKNQNKNQDQHGQGSW